MRLDARLRCPCLMGHILIATSTAHFRLSLIFFFLCLGTNRNKFWTIFCTSQKYIIVVNVLYRYTCLQITLQTYLYAHIVCRKLLFLYFIWGTYKQPFFLNVIPAYSRLSFKQSMIRFSFVWVPLRPEDFFPLNMFHFIASSF